MSEVTTVRISACSQMIGPEKLGNSWRENRRAIFYFITSAKRAEASYYPISRTYSAKSLNVVLCVLLGYILNFYFLLGLEQTRCELIFLCDKQSHFERAVKFR
jgi:hypothetical protein